MPSVEQLNLNRTVFTKSLNAYHGPEKNGTYWVIPQMPLSGPRVPIRLYFRAESGWFDIDENGGLSLSPTRRIVDMWIEQLPEPPRRASSHGGNHIA